MRTMGKLRIKTESGDQTHHQEESQVLDQLLTSLLRVGQPAWDDLPLLII